MRSSRPALLLTTGVAVVCVSALSGCSKDNSSSSGASYDVKAGDKSCDVSDTSIPAGKATFKIENTGSNVTEVYVYGKSGSDFTTIMGEVENIGPGTSRDLDVSLSAGDYQVACKPGMTGDGIRTDITVTGGSDSESSDNAEPAYDRELEVEVEKSGEVKPPEQLTAEVGERIEFKLDNASGEEHYLEVLDPDGTSQGEAEAAANGDGEFVAELTEAGSYTLKTYPDGAEDKATTTTLRVSSAG